MTSKKVLIVDDEPEFVEMIKMRLEANKYEFFTASNGAEAIAMATAKRPDLMLLDVTMPQMDGFDVLEQLRSTEATRRLPVVMLTARRESKFLLRSQDLKACDYLMKPCDQKELLAVVRKYA
jgi:DNA-binding response OmpR family regulator